MLGTSSRRCRISSRASSMSGLGVTITTDGIEYLGMVESDMGIERIRITRCWRASPSRELEIDAARSLSQVLGRRVRGAAVLWNDATPRCPVPQERGDDGP